jgi:hypothetical protein
VGGGAKQQMPNTERSSAAIRAEVVEGEDIAVATQCLRRTLHVESIELADELVFISERNTGVTLRIIQLCQPNTGSTKSKTRAETPK